MKNILRVLPVIALLAMCLTGFVSEAHAVDGYSFNITASTYPITEAATMAAQVSGKGEINMLILSNSGATGQTVTIYDLASSTTTVTAIMTIVLPAAIGNTIVNFPDFNPEDFNNLCVRKSTTATTINIYGRYK